MIILIIEDLPEEQQRAKEAVLSEGFRPAVTSTLTDAMRIWKSLEGKLVGIITDLHFPERTSDNPKWADPEKPCGLAIIARATQKALPVVVCSNIDHHFAEYVKEVIDVLETYHPTGRIPFVMDRKDWKQAIQELKKIIAKKGEL